MIKVSVIFITAILGLVGASLIGPSVLRWYFESPVNVGFNCAPAVEWAIQKCMIVQTAGLAAGFLCGGALVIVFSRRKASSGNFVSK